ncbi:hypothetical protein NQ315_013983 [Exocentrus adspersus]|uniref:Transposase n=1 Tax=Exocentrus adspersus TaxID=1586481 RepID=A0AAV8VHA0_9CUCU|nr:hypothetical protein NQ315_013983 [Exocentrus adspersus]
MKSHLEKFHREDLNKKQAELLHSAGQPQAQTITNNQPTIIHALQKMRVWNINIPQARQYHYLIGEMICLDNQPFSIVNDTGFKRLINKAVPNYNIPSDKYFRENIIPDIYERTKTTLKEKLKKMTGNISFTTDIWTCSYTNNSFISLTGHWLDTINITTSNNNVSWKRCSFVLACKHFPGSHTGEAIATALTNLLKDWDLKTEQVHLIIADNAVNMSKGINEAGLNYQPCFVHTLQLVIKDAMGSQRAITDLFAKAKQIVGHFNHSSLACYNLEQIQLRLKMGFPKKTYSSK